VPPAAETAAAAAPAVEPVPLIGDDTVIGTTFVSQAAQRDEADATSASSKADSVAEVVSPEEGTDAGPVRSVTLELSDATVKDENPDPVKGTAPVPGETDNDDASDPLPPADNFPTAGLHAPRADEPDSGKPTK
jgi:hypothetical protein